MLLFVRLGGIASRLFLSAGRIVVRSDSKLIFIDGAIALASDIKDLPQIYVRPDFRPLRIEIPVDGSAEFVRRLLEIILFEEQLTDPVVGERAHLIHFQS